MQSRRIFDKPILSKDVPGNSPHLVTMGCFRPCIDELPGFDPDTRTEAVRITVDERRYWPALAARRLPSSWVGTEPALAHGYAQVQFRMQVPFPGTGGVGTVSHSPSESGPASLHVHAHL